MPFMVGVGEGIEKVIEPWYAAAVVGRTCEITIDADWIAHIRQDWKLLLEDDGVLPVIAEIVSIDKLSAGPPEYTGELNIALAFHPHSHTEVFRVWPSEVTVPGTEFVHMAVMPTHCGLQPIVQLRQSHRCRNKQAAPDGRFRAEQGDLDLIDVLGCLSSFHRHISSFG